MVNIIILFLKFSWINIIYLIMCYVKYKNNNIDYVEQYSGIYSEVYRMD